MYIGVVNTFVVGRQMASSYKLKVKEVEQMTNQQHKVIKPKSKMISYNQNKNQGKDFRAEL